MNQQDLNGKGPSKWEKLRAPCFGNAPRFNENTNSQGRAETPATTESTKIGQSYSKVEPVADVDSKAQNIPPISSYSANKTTFSNVAVCGCILNQSVRLLVDTGAAISVVSEQFYNVTLRPNVQLKKNNLISNIKTADGNTTPVIGFVSFEIIIGDHSYNCDASVVPNLAYQVVLGCDFLHANNAIIDVKRESVTFEPKHTVMFTKGCNSLTVPDVHNAKTYVISSQSEGIIPAYQSMHVDLVVGFIEAHCKVSDTHPIIDTPATLLHKGNCIVTFCTSTNEVFIADVGCDPAIPVLKNVATATNADGIARFSSLWSHIFHQMKVLGLFRPSVHLLTCSPHRPLSVVEVRLFDRRLIPMTRG